MFRFLLLALLAWHAFAQSPRIVRVFPLGGQAGADVMLEILGEHLSNASGVEFDCADLKWTKTIDASSGKLTGLISIAANAAPGPHMLRVAALDGYSTSTMFNVGQFPSMLEREPNDEIKAAQTIEKTPIEIQGRLDGSADIDVYAIRVLAGERKVFDLRSIERGSALEARMYLLDARGNRIAFNDDRGDFDDNPLIEHTFEKEGVYYVVLDQYRGPRGFNFGKNCAYVLRISDLPLIQWYSPLGARRRATVRVRIKGSALDSVRRIYLTEARRAEYYRMTYPYTMPIQFRQDPRDATNIARIEGILVARNRHALMAEFAIPAETRPGLWRLWTATPAGVTEADAFVISDMPEYGEADGGRADWTRGPYVINGELSQPGEEDVFRIDGKAGRPLRFRTLAAQLGVAQLDTVLRLRDAAGKKLAENDDVVAGQGTLIGNPDSCLFYTPQLDGPLFLSVFDRTRRGGPGFIYRLEVASERPGFQLFTTPENFAIARGGTAELKVHLIRETGFEGAVSVWFEGMPPGIEAPRGAFRADQLFEPNADGADMIVPEITFRIHAPDSLAPGVYPIRVFGAPDKDPGRVVEAQTTMIQGPLLDAWNYIRRPLPRIEMTVCEPFQTKLITQTRSMNLERGGSATLELKTEKLPQDAQLALKNAPEGVNWRVLSRQADQLTLLVQADSKAPLGSFDLFAEAKAGRRWASTEAITLVLSEAK